MGLVAKPNDASNKSYSPKHGTELLILFLITAVVFILRLQFRQISFWEWDELLFASGIHQYNLWAHSPHPPSYILWIGILRLFYKIGGHEVWAQTTANAFFGSLTVFPLYYLFRRVASFPIALGAVLVFVFNPVVWAEGETGFSDTTACFWSVLALSFLAYGERNGFFYWGCFLLGVALGVRVQNMFMGVFIMLPIWQKLREWDLKAVIVGLGIFGCTCLAWFIPTAVYGAGGFEPYFQLIEAMSRVTAAEDTWALTPSAILARCRWSLRETLGTTWGGLYLAIPANLLALAGMLVYVQKKQWRELLIMFACFVPYFVFACLFLAVQYIKYTIPYLPFFAFFISVAVYELATRAGRWRIPAYAASLVLIISLFTAQALPCLKILHREKSPTERAVDYIKANLPPEKTFIYYDRAVRVWVNFYLKNYKAAVVAVEPRPAEIPPDPGMDAYVFSGDYPEMGSTEQRQFQQQSPELSLLGFKYVGSFYNVWVSKADIAYFDFVPRPERTSQWLRERGYCFMRNNKASDKILTLKGRVPLGLFKQPPQITIALNGQPLAQFYPETEELQKVFTIPGESLAPDGWSKLEITSDQTFNPANSEFAQEADGNLSWILESMTWTDRGAAEVRPPAVSAHAAPAEAGAIPTAR